MTGEDASDTWLPEWDVRERHRLMVPAALPVAWRALHEADLASSRLVRLLFGLRGLGAREPVKIRALVKRGFVLLDTAEPRDLVLGLIGRPWRVTGDLRTVSPDAFRTFAQPGYVRITWTFSLTPVNDSTLLKTETRVAATSDAARRRFRAYWWFIGPFSSVIRRRMLRAVAKAAVMP